MGWGKRTYGLFFALFALLVIAQQAGALAYCDSPPSRSFAAYKENQIINLTDDLYCPGGNLSAAIWLSHDKGLVIDCGGHSIGGDGMSAVLIEDSAGIVFLNCNLTATPPNAPVLYVNTSGREVMFIKDTMADPAAYIAAQATPNGSAQPQEKCLGSAAGERIDTGGQQRLLSFLCKGTGLATHLKNGHLSLQRYSSCSSSSS